MNSEKQHYHGHRQRLRQRFLTAGFKGFADHEIVELLLTLAIPRLDVKQPAKELVQRFGNLRGVLDAPIDEVKQIKGIGEVAPVALRIIREAATLYLQQSAENKDAHVAQEQLADFWRMRIGALPNEVFQVAYLDNARRVLHDAIETLEEGTVDRAAVYPRRVIEAALRRGACGLIFAHNHPNGDVNPSEHDKLLTRALVLAANTVQLQVLDHLIVSKDSVYSFKKEGLL